MNRLLLFLVLLFASSSSEAQVDHLVPPYFGREELYTHYKKTVVERLLPDLKDKPIVAHILIPSYNTEYSFSIKKGAMGDYLFTYREPLRSIWYSGYHNHVDVKRITVPIDSNLVIKFQELFDIALSYSKKTEKYPFGLDGANYYFLTFNPDGKLMVGETWSPKEGTKMGGLTKLCFDLIFYQIDSSNGNDSTRFWSLTAPPETHLSKQQLMTDIEELILKFKS